MTETSHDVKNEISKQTQKNSLSSERERERERFILTRKINQIRMWTHEYMM